jgi:hypothetical protein
LERENFWFEKNLKKILGVKKGGRSLASEFLKESLENQ